MSTTQTKKLSEATVVQSIADADKIPIVNSSGQTVLVPLSGLLGAVKVGGRNLLRNSGVEISNNNDLIATYLYGDDTPEAGEKLVVSVWAELGPNVKAMTFFSQHIEGGNDSFSILPTDIKRDGRYVKQFTATKKPYRIIVYQGPGLSDNTTIERIKVERGNIPTDWTPAPEDWGGVKTSLSAVCAFAAQLSKQKGGSQHEPNEGLDKHGAQGYHDGRDGHKRNLRRLRHVYKSGNMACGYRNSQSTGRGLSIRSANRNTAFPVLLSGVSAGLFKPCNSIYLQKDDIYERNTRTRVSTVAERARHIRVIGKQRKEVAV